MLPFLDSKRLATLVLQKKGEGMSSIANEKDASNDDSNEPFKACSEDMLAAIESKSVLDLARALKDFCDLCESSEGDEPSEGYEDQV